jgi:hypothetical protein
MTYDRLAERYLDKVIPRSRVGVSEVELKRRGLDPALYDEALEVQQELTKDGMKPTMDQIVVAVKKRRHAAARRGI